MKRRSAHEAARSLTQPLRDEFLKIGSRPVTMGALVRAAFAALLFATTFASAQTTSGNATTGATRYTAKGCNTCHAAGIAKQANAINAGGHITHANTQGMGGAANVGTDYNDIAAYFATLYTGLAAQNVTFGNALAIAIPNIVLATTYGDYAGLRQVSAPTRGSVSFAGTTATYTPTTGQCGSDSFTYEAFRTPSGTSNVRSVSLTIANPSAPSLLFTPSTQSGFYQTFLSFSPVSSGGTPTSYILSAGTLPTGMSLSSVSGTISGVPTQVGSFPITLQARNCFNGNSIGQTGSKAITITINPANQGALTARINGLSADQVFNYSSPSGTAALTTSQNLPNGSGVVSYAVTAESSPGTCTIASTTLTLAKAGACTVTATKAADPFYNLVSDSIGVTINKANQATLTASALSSVLGFGTNTTLSSIGGSGTGAVSFSSNNSNCTIVGNVLTAAAVGSCNVTATKAADNNYFIVNSLPIVITINAVVPGAPTGAIASPGDAAATVTFAAPVNTGGSPITGYTVTSNPPGGVDSNAGTTGLSHIVTGLANGTPYTFTVRASNIAGAGPASAASNSVTPSATPVPPAINSVNSAAFTVLTAGTTFTVTATGTPTPAVTLFSGSLPTAMSFAPGLGSGVLSGTPATGKAGSYPLTFRASSTAGSTTQSFTLIVNKRNQTITFTPTTPQEFSPTPLPLTAAATLGPVTFSRSTPGTCDVTGSTYTTLALGNCNLIADQAGDIDYNPISSGKVPVEIIQGSQVITFPSQSAQTFSPSGIFALAPPATISSGLAPRYGTLTPSVCTVPSKFDPQVTILAAGLCTIEANEDGDAFYLPAAPVSQNITISQASQIIVWGAQSNQPFGAGGTFAISPLASGGASGNPVLYSASPASVCTLSGTTVTKVSPGLCTLSADQAGDGNFTAAPQVQRTLAITASVPGAPLATQLTASDSQIIVEFTPPANNGGTAITGYIAACGPNGQVAAGANSPIVVTGLTNNTTYSCAVFAQNSAGNSQLSNVLMATPTLASGTTLWTTVCATCHGAVPAGVRFNAAGTTGTVINYVRSVQPAMLTAVEVQALTVNELAEIAKYIATFVPPISANTPFNTPANINVSSHLTLGTLTFDGAEVVDTPLHGTLSVFSGTQIVYTPTPGYTGPDSFTYRGFRNTPILKGDKRTVTINVAAPPIPVITSPAIAAGTFNTPFAYQITATNSPTSFAAAPLGVNFTINTANGLISGTPAVTGTFVVTVSATNAGGTGTQDVNVTISKASQTITFGAQASQPFVPGGTFPLSPVATVNSPLAVSYSPLTPAVCSISGITVTMLTAGVCMIAADQAGNANYNAALQVAQPINIAASAPGAPTIGASTPGDTVAAIAFTPPASNGGSAITSYTATCLPNGSGSSGASPITVSGLTNGVTYTCSVTATNAINTGPPSGTVTVTPTATAVAPQITSANNTTFVVGAPSAFAVTATGTPTPTLALSGALPSGVTFTPATGALAGTPALGTVNAYPLTVTASNASGTPMQSFTLTVAKADQTISFTGPVSQPFSSTPINLTATSSSTLPVTLTSNSTSVCTVLGTTLTIVGIGTCSITATQTGDANYNAATSVTQGFTVSQATQSINFPAQVPASRSFVAGSTFPISPVATATSGLGVIYTSTTTGVCTVVGLNATMLAPGTCTIAANQSGSANFQAAAQATQNVTLSTTVPGAPVIGAATGGNGQATINFTPPANNGGSAITSYTATCNPGNISAVGGASPIIVSGLANNTIHTCSVTAANGVGDGQASAIVSVTPLSGQGAALWAQVCDVCHTSVPSGNQLNGAGTTATVLNFVRANQGSMIFNAAVQSLSNADLVDIANYIAASIPPNNVTTSVGVPVAIDVGNHITLTGQAWSAFTAVEIVTGPAHGTVGAFTGTQIQYTPAPGYVGPDSFTYRGKHPSGIAFNGDPQTVTIAVNPLPPVITSANTASGIFGIAFSYRSTATNSPTSFDISGLPAGLTASPAGLISGLPTEPGQFSVSISANNAGGMGSITLTLQIDPAPQTIIFGAQASPRTYSAGGTFAISPLATGGASGNPIVYGSNQPTVCTVSGATVTMMSAGVCAITANQAGDANYAAAAPAIQNVTINPTVPAAPVIGTATPGNTTATIAFTPALNNTGGAITGFNASCTPSGAGSGAASPITISSLTNGVTYTCSVTATNSAGTSLPSAGVAVTPGSVVPPGAPTIGSATPGNTQATIAFTPPASDGGGAISSYTATCNPGNFVASNTISPITVPNLVNGTLYSCSVTASNSAGIGAASGAVNVTPLPTLALAAVVSRKTHGGVGDFDVVVDATIALSGLISTESRGIGTGHTLIFQFNNPIIGAGNVTATDSLGAALGSASALASGNNVIVTLTGVPDNKRVTVTLTNVNGEPIPFSASVGFMIGDVNSTRSVNSSDVSGVKARSGQATDASNFRFDVNATGTVNSSDISAVKARSGTTLAP